MLGIVKHFSLSWPDQILKWNSTFDKFLCITEGYTVKVHKFHTLVSLHLVTQALVTCHFFYKQNTLSI
jgi:hypothetical protein